MAKYLKFFETHSAYNTYITGNDKILPNVSYCEDNNDVHYNPWTDPRVIVTYNVTSTSEAITLTQLTSCFSEMEIDGVVQPSVVGSYQFDTTGEHIVKYTLVEGTTTIGYFTGTPIKSIIIPNSITSIDASAFISCESLTSVTIGSGVTSIGNSAFQSCMGLTKVKIPDNVTSLGTSVFQYCTGLTSVTLGGGLTSISNQTFFGCTNLASLTIPSNITSIGDVAIRECSSLTSITIPSSVTSIGGGAFYNCSGLASVTVEATTPPTLGSAAFNGTASGRKIYVPSASVATYKAASGWSTYASDIEAIS